MKQRNNKINQARRKAVTLTAASAVVGTAWHKPLIDSVVLPAHAQTSTGGVTDDGISQGQVFFLEGADDNRNRAETAFNPLNLLVEEAVAGGRQPGRNSWVRMVSMGGGEFSYEQLNRNTSVRREGTAVIGDIASMDIVEDCRVNNDNGNDNNNAAHFVEIIDADSDGVSISINDTTILFIPAGDGTVPACFDTDGD